MVMPSRIKHSLQISDKPNPLIMIDFTMKKNHLDGTAFEMICMGNGMLSMGNKNPLNINVGRKRPTNETNIATVCVFAIDEINMPRDKEVMMNNIPTASNKIMLPFNGTFNTK